MPEGQRNTGNIEHEEKRFKEWIERKEILHEGAKLPKIKEGDIWWCGVGENVGVEINGKSEAFSRPVIVFRKLSRYGFMGIPLTSQPHEGSWYVHFVFKGMNEWAALAQARTFSVSRLYKQIGALSDADFEFVRSGFNKLYCSK